MVDNIPISVLQNRSLSILESIVQYLKDEENLRFSEIGLLLNRDERNIWTVYKRAKNKLINSFKQEEIKKNINGKNNLNKTRSFSIYGVNR